MITELTFEKFRGFADLRISPVKRINLIAGANNTGKTGILEGLYLLCVGDSAQVGRLPAVFRSSIQSEPFPHNDDFSTFWQALFYDKQTTDWASISATVGEGEVACHLREGRDGKGAILVMHKSPPEGVDLPPAQSAAEQLLTPSFLIGPGGPSGKMNNPFATPIIVVSTKLEEPASDADLFNQVSLLEGGEERLVSLLRKVDDRLQKLRYLKAPGTSQPLVYAHFGLKNALSMNQTGQGFSKLFSLFCKMLVTKAEVLLIDEIENGLYYESLPTIWKGLSELAASEDIQVFATTHSRECIVAAHETFSSTADYDFALH